MSKYYKQQFSDFVFEGFNTIRTISLLGTVLGLESYQYAIRIFMWKEERVILRVQNILVKTHEFVLVIPTKSLNRQANC